MKIDRFIDFAIHIASSLTDVHHENIVHKNVVPENIFIHPQSLRSNSPTSASPPFSLGTRCGSQPHLIEGSLPYISPEQTGRRNRSVDSRSDLYSLGITYQMLTGRLPFEARDPLEWIHSHLARLPPAP